MSWCVSPWVYPVRDSLWLLDLIDYFHFHVGEIFSYNLFKIFLIAWWKVGGRAEGRARRAEAADSRTSSRESLLTAAALGAPTEVTFDEPWLATMATTWFHLGMVLRTGSPPTLNLVSCLSSFVVPIQEAQTTSQPLSCLTYIHLHLQALSLSC